MFRCPSCAVVWKLPLTNGYSLLAHPDMVRHSIVKEPITLTSEFTTVIGMEEVMQAMWKKGLVFDGYYLGAEVEGVESDTSPVLQCPSCDKHHSFATWHAAYNLPGDFFDADQLCHCGGELWYDKIPGSPRYALICEKCDWFKPKTIISGHEG